MKKQVVVYARVSTLTQKANETIKDQVNLLKTYAKNKYKIIDIIKDNGVSGAEMDRAVSLIDRLANSPGKIQGLLCKSLDRLSRDLYIQLWIEKELKKLGIGLILAEQENLNGDKPMIKAFRQMIGVFAELEKNTIVTRLKSGRKHKTLDRGIKASGKTPLGYKYSGKTTKDKKIVVDPKEAELVNKIFNLYIKKRSLSRVKKELDNLNLSNRKNKKFSRQSLALILKNKFYLGLVKYAGIEKPGDHKAIIEKKTFAEVKRILKKKSKR